MCILSTQWEIIDFLQQFWKNIENISYYICSQFETILMRWTPIGWKMNHRKDLEEMMLVVIKSVVPK